MVDSFTYLGIIFSPGGSFNKTFETLAGQAMKANYRLKSYLVKFPGLTVKHKLDLFDKLILPILNYGSEVWGLNDSLKLILPILNYESEVWGLNDSLKLERIHLSFCKNLLCVRYQTQNNFIYGELGRTSLRTKRSINLGLKSFSRIQQNIFEKVLT